MGQTSFGFNGRFRPISLPLFQGALCQALCQDGAGFWRSLVVPEAEPLPPQRRIAVYPLRTLCEKGPDAPMPAVPTITEAIAVCKGWCLQ
jgi:hypothetical protein